MCTVDVGIVRLSEHNAIEYYRAWTDELEFYMGIDKANRSISFYLSTDFSQPTRVIVVGKGQPIGELPGIPLKVFARALSRAMHILSPELFT